MMPDGHFVVRESYIDMGRVQCRNTTTLISALVDLADDLVEFVVKQGDASLRDPRVQMLIEHERQPRVSDEEITRIWLDDKREHVKIIPSTRRDSSSVYGVNHIDWVYPDQFVHIGKSEKQWQWGEQVKLMMSDDPVELQRSWLYSSWNGWTNAPDDHGMMRWDTWLSSKKSRALRAKLETMGAAPGD